MMGSFISGYGLPEYELPVSVKKEIFELGIDPVLVERACIKALSLVDEPMKKLGNNSLKVLLRKAHESASKLKKDLEKLRNDGIFEPSIAEALYFNKRPEKGYINTQDCHEYLGNIAENLAIFITAASGNETAKPKRNIDKPRLFLKYQLYLLCGRPRANNSRYDGKGEDKLSILYRILKPYLCLEGIKLPKRASADIANFQNHEK